MRSWPAPDVPTLPLTAPPVRVHDTATGTLVESRPEGAARLYVCGITPYDATHMGHAATFLGFDLLNRAWRSAGHEVRYVQNVTDVDDPLLERAEQVGMDWTALAERETQLLRDDLEALRILPPDHYVGAVESIPRVIELIQHLEGTGSIYRVGDDLYFSVSADPTFGSLSDWDRETMVPVFAERGGDPQTPGKRDPLDCVVWRAERPGEPAWDSPFGRGRPGWHIECTAIARDHLGTEFDVQGGGSDLVFPHHEMCAAQAQVASPEARFARAYVHAGMVGLDGEKMSKSKGNLVFVSDLRRSGVDPMAIRLLMLGHHYRSEWEWFDEELDAAVGTLAQWRTALDRRTGAPAQPFAEEVLAALADDLDAPRAVAAVQAWVDVTLSEAPEANADPGAGDLMRVVLDGALGLAS